MMFCLIVVITKGEEVVGEFAEDDTRAKAESHSATSDLISKAGFTNFYNSRSTTSILEIED